VPAVRRDATRTVDIPGGCSFRTKVPAVAIRDTVTKGETRTVEDAWLWHNEATP